MTGWWQTVRSHSQCSTREWLALSPDWLISSRFAVASGPKSLLYELPSPNHSSATVPKSAHRPPSLALTAHGIRTMCDACDCHCADTTC